MKILKNRIYNGLDENRDKTQARVVRHSFSTVDHIHTINQVSEKSIEYNLETHLLFINFNKALDTIHRS